MRPHRAVVVVVASVVALALLLAGGLAAGLAVLGGEGATRGSPERTGGPGSPGSPVAAAAAATRTPPERALAPFYDQEPAWTACPEEEAEDPATECATLAVPVDYDDPRGDTLDLALLRVPAAGGDPVAALVVNPGGPGAPGTSYAAAADRVLGPALREALDTVGFDPRGVGASAPVDCLDDEALDAYVAADPVPDTPAEGAAYESAQEAFFDGCEARTGAQLAHVSTVEAARDMDVLRAALDQPRLVYLGASYGTDLGATYAELFPDRVGRLVLDGGIDPSLTQLELALGQAEGFETALRAYVEHCTDTVSGCYLGEDVEGGLAMITGLLDDVDEAPLPTSEDRDLAVGQAFYGLVLPLYDRELWPVLDQALRAGLDGDGSPLLLLSDLYLSREDDTYADNSAEAIAVVRCSDDPTSVGAEEVPGLLPRFAEVSPTLGDVFAWSLVGCRGVPADLVEPGPRVDGAGADPIVVVGTTRDPATPYAWSVGLAERLESAVLVTRDGDGHTGYRTGNACVDATVEDYLLDGTAPRADVSC